MDSYNAKIISILLLSAFYLSTLNAQVYTDEKEAKSDWFVPDLEISAFVDTYYAVDLLDNTPNKTIQPFLFNHNRNREFQVNLAMLKVAAKSNFYRAVVHLQTGTYAFDNYASEPTLYQTLYEAYAGISLNENQNLWIDVGIFESHIGYESAISIKNYTLTRSLMAENSPYFLTGARLSYEPNDNWLFVFVLSNGWQRIERPNEQKWPALGTQVAYKWGNGLTFNWSTFYGAEFTMGESRSRFYNNLFLRRDLPSKLSWILGFDFGIQEGLFGVDETHSWYAANALLSYPLSSNWRTAARLERYSDPYFSIIGPGFSAWAGSVHFDYQPIKAAALRFEVKYLKSDLSSFEEQHQLLFTTSISAEIGG
ncbi:MAG: outer membrane beta-barrel protein [Bacteroidetes bacterium]|jgi:hypothetical protein|nr:outer membrane beta-barrel protein [Bacteroidota bacterium]